jgi:DNA-binding Lrp family transcriptional regulator
MVILNNLYYKLYIMNLDDFDRALIDLLNENARLPHTELARRLGCSRTTIYSRLERLETSGIIQGYKVQCANEIHQSQVRAHVLISCLARHAAKVETALKQILDVKTVHSVSGVYDLIIIVSANSVSDLDKSIDAIGMIEGVERTTTSVILSTRLDR